MKIMMKSLVMAIALTAGLAGQAQALDGTPAVTPTSYLTFSQDGPWTLGFSFVATASLSVSALGAFDALHDGFADSHSVGLWDASGSLLASTSVASSDTLIGDFRYSAITAVTLIAGKTYYVGASNFGVGDDFGYGGTVNAATGITYTSSAFARGSTLLFPARIDGVQPGFYGGNLLVNAVPEPATYAMLLAGLGLIGLAGRRKHGRSPAL